MYCCMRPWYEYEKACAIEVLIDLDYQSYSALC